jgi:hypothetical protein
MENLSRKERKNKDKISRKIIEKYGRDFMN